MYYRKSYKWVVVAGILLFTAAARAKDSKLRIHVEPKQAYIFVDGVPFGDSGRSINIAPGNHTIGVYNYGFTAQVREVSVEPGTIMGIDFKLDAVPGTITGPWGRIQIESATRSAVLLTSKTPEYFVGHGDEFNHGGAFLPCCVQQLVVPAGAHLVTIVDKGKELWSGTVNVGANERVIINAASGKQRVKSWHQGGTIGTLPRFKAGKASTTVAVAPVSGNLVAQPAQINCGDSSQLAWTTAETVERAITSGTESMKQSAVSGEVAVKPIETTTYGFQASGPGGSVTSSTTVNVNTAVQGSLQASPQEIRYRRIGDKVLEQGSSNLTWSASNASTASIDPLGPVKTNDNHSVMAVPKHQNDGPVNEVQTYVLTAKNECGGSDTQTISLRITGSIEPIPEVGLASVFFPTGHPDERHPEAGLVQSQQALLAQTAAGFKKYLEYDPKARLSVVGNTDERDSNARNKPLSRRRANRVKDYLVSLGVPEGKIETVAQGKEHPLDATTVKSLHQQNPNKPAKSLGSFRDLVWAYNRRVDIVLQPKGEVSTQYYPATVAEAPLLFSSEWPDRMEIITLASAKDSLPVQSKPEQK